MSALPKDARSLFAAAREDGPSEEARDAVFRRVALVTGMTAGAVTVSAVAAANAAVATETAGLAATAKVAAGSVLSVKPVAVGALLGALTTGFGVLVAMGATAGVPRPLPASPSPYPPAAVAETPVVATSPTLALDDARPEASGAKPAKEANIARTPAAVATTKPAAEARAVVKAKAGTGEVPSDLGEEARLLTAARKALLDGDPGGCLALVHATRKLGARALEPEELNVEARALRALGRIDDAVATELVLRRRYPDSVLAH